MSKKITKISELSTEKYLESIDSDVSRYFYSRREFGTKVEIEGVEYVFTSNSIEDLDKLVDEKKREIILEKRNKNIDDIIK